jgi:hypothetical protein
VRPVTLTPGARLVDASPRCRYAAARRPHAYLDPEIPAGISTFHLPGVDSLLGGLDQLAEDLKTGRWKQRNRELLDRTELDVGHRLLIAQV